MPNSCGNNPCVNGGTCQSLTNGSYYCYCRASFWGQNCSKAGCVDGMLEASCGKPCNRTCDNPHPFCMEVCMERCECPMHMLWSDNWQECVYSEDCPKKEPCGRYNETCMNGGTCRPNMTCECPPGYTGPFCRNQTSGCASMGCWNGGTCYDGYCSCRTGYTGERCEIMIPNNGTCGLKGCLNGGSCWGFSCMCQEGFSGVNCEIKLQNNSRCGEWGCMNNGTCYNDYCYCAVNFTGKFCEIDMRGGDSCDYLGCQNWGTCEDGYCMCPDGFSGMYCEIEIRFRPCVSNPCWNNGTCMEMNAGYWCSCKYGNFGDHCQNGKNGTNCPQCMDEACYADMTCTYGCQNGMYGDYCHLNCSRNCREHMCDQYGVCVMGCVNGTHGPMCEETCGCKTKVCSDDYYSSCWEECDTSKMHCDPWDRCECDPFDTCQGYDCVTMASSALCIKMSGFMVAAMMMVLAVFA